MDFATEQKMREEKLSAMCGGAATPYGMAQTATLGLAYDEPCRTPLRERVQSQLVRSHQEARKEQQLQELAQLLDENPKIARILDLIEIVRG